MGPCVSDFGCSEGGRASLTDAGCLASDARRTHYIHQSPGGVSVHVKTARPAQRTHRADAGVLTEGSNKCSKKLLKGAKWRRFLRMCVYELLQRRKKGAVKVSVAGRNQMFPPRTLLQMFAIFHSLCSRMRPFSSRL